MEQVPRFANVQFEFESEHVLVPIVDFLGDRVIVHYEGLRESENFASVSLSRSEWEDGWDAETIIADFCGLLEAMPEAVRHCWDACSIRVFDIGLESGITGSSLSLSIGPKTLERVVRAGATLAITLYSVPDPVK
jgi:hypothetical protein